MNCPLAISPAGRRGVIDLSGMEAQAEQSQTCGITSRSQTVRHCCCGATVSGSAPRCSSAATARPSSSGGLAGVGVGEEQQGAGRREGALMAGPGLPVPSGGQFGSGNQPKAWVGRGAAAHDVRGGVGRAIVHHEQFEIGIGGGEDGANHRLDGLRLVPRRDDDADHGARTGASCSRSRFSSPAGITSGRRGTREGRGGRSPMPYHRRQFGLELPELFTMSCPSSAVSGAGTPFWANRVATRASV